MTNKRKIFDAATLDKAAMMKSLCKERADKEPSASTVLGKFNTHENAFLNLMLQPDALEFSRNP